jgi:hypothetical protein
MSMTWHTNSSRHTVVCCVSCRHGADATVTDKHVQRPVEKLVEPDEAHAIVTMLAGVAYYHERKARPAPSTYRCSFSYSYGHIGGSSVLALRLSWHCFIAMVCADRGGGIAVRRQGCSAPLTHGTVPGPNIGQELPVATAAHQTRLSQLKDAAQLCKMHRPPRGVKPAAAGTCKHHSKQSVATPIVRFHTTQASTAPQCTSVFIDTHADDMTSLDTPPADMPTTGCKPDLNSELYTHDPVHGQQMHGTTANSAEPDAEMTADASDKPKPSARIISLSASALQEDFSLSGCNDNNMDMPLKDDSAKRMAFSRGRDSAADSAFLRMAAMMDRLGFSTVTTKTESPGEEALAPQGGHLGQTASLDGTMDVGNACGTAGGKTGILGDDVRAAAIAAGRCSSVEKPAVPELLASAKQEPVAVRVYRDAEGKLSDDDFRRIKQAQLSC